MRNRSLVLVVFVLLCLAAPVAAQDIPWWKIAGGYSFTRDVTDEATLPAGWFVSGAGNVTDMLAIVGEVSGAYKDNSEPELGFEAVVALYTIMGGVRYYRRRARVTPFAQFLLGISSWRTSATFGGFSRSTVSGPHFVIQPGAGVDIRLTDRLAARVQGDWRRIFSADEAHGAQAVDSNQIRIAAGIVVGFGSR